MPRKATFTVAQVRDALTKTGGIYSHAAAALAKATGKPCSRNGIKGYVERHPELADLCEEARETEVDIAESKLWLANRAGEPWAVRAVLFGSPAGRARGYSFRLEQTGKDGSPLIPGVIVIPAEENDPAAWAARYKPASSTT